MRSTRWLLLLAILAILGGTGALYQLQRKIVKAHTPAKPEVLPLDTNSLAYDYEYAQSTGGLAKFKVRAKKFRQIGDTTQFELEGVELQITKETDPAHFDLIQCAKARFDKGQAKMYSDSEVQITLDVPVTGQPLHPLTSIKTSGVNFDSKSGKASSDRPASFQFASGHGTCTGALYDPNSKELHLLKATDLILQGANSKSPPMHVVSDELVYQEGSSVIHLNPWAKMQRADTDAESAGPATIHLKDGNLESIDAQKGRGSRKDPKRQMAYGADLLHLQYSSQGELTKMIGTGNSYLHSIADTGLNNVTGDKVDMDFVPRDGESILTRVFADGHAVVETKPSPAEKKRPLPETKLLHSNTVEMIMRPDGREIDHVQTQTPGVLEFFPNEPKQHRRLLNGERMLITYGAQNQIQSFSSENVTTETFPAAADKNKNAKPSKTASVHMTADFEPKSGQMQHMKQWDHFTYEEGDRRARAVTATFDQASDSMKLEEQARVWDATGSTDGDTILLNQKTDDFTADGHVNTTRLPDQKKTSSEMLDGDQPTQGQARHMTSVNHNRLVHYEGSAVLWQEANRIQGDVIDLNRDKHTLAADGHVITTFLDSGNGDGKGKDAAKDPKADAAQPSAPKPASKPDDKASAEPVFTTVRSPKLFYTETDRLAHYTGGVLMERPGLTVRSEDLKAWLNPKDAKEESKINHAVAENHVEIVEDTPERHRTGKAEHSEYYTAEARILLRGGDPELVDNKKGTTKGTELTYFTNDDRLLVTGEAKKPVKSTLHRKHAVS